MPSMTLSADPLPRDAADQALVDGVLAEQRRPLAKTITLIESQRADHKQRARSVLEGLLPHTGRSMRAKEPPGCGPTQAPRASTAGSKVSRRATSEGFIGAAPRWGRSGTRPGASCR